MSHPAPPSAPAEFLVLHGRHSSLVLEHHADEAPLWRYWGPRLSDGSGPGLPLRDSRPLPSFMLDHDQPLTVMPGFGVGWLDSMNRGKLDLFVANGAVKVEPGASDGPDRTARAVEVGVVRGQQLQPDPVRRRSPS